VSPGGGSRPPNDIQCIFGPRNASGESNFKGTFMKNTCLHAVYKQHHMEILWSRVTAASHRLTALICDHKITTDNKLYKSLYVGFEAF